MDIRRLIAARLPDIRAASVVPLGEGTDHVAFLMDGRLVVRCARVPDAAGVVREARVLAAVAAVSPLPVPEPVFVAPDAGCLAYSRLPGVPLLDVPQAQRAREAARIAADLGRVLKALHGVAPDRVVELVERDDVAPEEWRDEAGAHYAAVAPAVPAAHRRAVRAFLAAPAPARSSGLVFSHNDLGIEHVLVDPGTREPTGIIDWSDAALTDPARDFGLILRDLRPAALDAALGAYRPAGAALRDRARFYARCALLEDLAFGLETERTPYVEKSLAALAWLFPA